ncbi:hypothetical protein L6Q21_12350 [Sandaracinobacter sp. RS1-74]|uniref:hypothetical protein n=1 Tax=Sandaracinobacteroides sayramensis TaxID=2913411 RepID=UPI001ED9FAFB|nr:hypothetical protein [Sandaracinobacteroides sayramensis]MCG2841774.1 hypothetical protein [Sandaracinobacteroides sayramensis]
MAGRIQMAGAVALLAAMAAPVAAQDGGWQIVLQPYLMVPAMTGSAAVKGFDADVDVGRKDVVKNLNIGFLGYVEVTNGRLGFAVDTNYMDLDATPDSARISANSSQLAVQPMLFYRVAQWFDLMLGARYNKISLKLESDLEAVDGLKRSKDWMDPIAGFRFQGPLGGATTFSLLANIGGFGLGSDLALQVKPMLSFGVGSGISIDAGYQLAYMDYESGSGRDRFAYDVLTHGPLLGVTFRF